MFRIEEKWFSDERAVENQTLLSQLKETREFFISFKCSDSASAEIEDHRMKKSLAVIVRAGFNQ